MDVKIDIPGIKSGDPSPLSYKPIPEKDIEEMAVTRPKSLLINDQKINLDEAKEKMLPNQKIDDLENGNQTIRQNGDTKLDFEEEVSCFVGLPKEELMKFAIDPFWIRLRWFLFIIFWILWATMVFGAIAIIFAAPKCDPPPPRTWWEKGLLSMTTGNESPNQIKQTDPNIHGLIIHWPGDIYPAELTDIQKNVVNLINVAKEADKHVIVDIDPTTSELWFEKSQNRIQEYADFYIWNRGTNYESDGKTNSKPPNNWVNRNNTSSWKYSSIRTEYYYAPFNRPHLNFRNRQVVEEFNKAIGKFLTMNVSGISLRNAAFLLVDPNLEDEEVINSKSRNVDHEQYDFYKHSKTEDLPELAQFLQESRNIIKMKTDNDGPLLIAEELRKIGAYKINDSFIIDLPYRSNVFSEAVNESINRLNYVFNIDNIQWPLWDIRRNHLETLPKDVLNIVTYLLPGVPLIRLNDTVDSTLIKLRNSPSIMRGNCEFFGLKQQTVFTFMRVTPGSPGILVAVNPTNQTSTINIPAEILPLKNLQEVTVRYYSSIYNETSFMDIGSKKNATAVPISSKSAIVLEYVPNSD